MLSHRDIGSLQRFHNVISHTLNGNFARNRTVSDLFPRWQDNGFLEPEIDNGKQGEIDALEKIQKDAYGLARESHLVPKGDLQ